jgi:hypothetical protein
MEYQGAGGGFRRHRVRGSQRHSGELPGVLSNCLSREGGFGNQALFAVVFEIMEDLWLKRAFGAPEYLRSGYLGLPAQAMLNPAFGRKQSVPC